MKRMHIHVGVENLASSIEFYTDLFSTAPTKLKEDYAQWLLEDPQLNFAISTRVNKVGVDHLGLQVDDAGELATLRAHIKAAHIPVSVQGVTDCCYARSDKSWIEDPSGIAWEVYQSMQAVEWFSSCDAQGQSTCCTPERLAQASSSPCCS